MQNVDPVHRAQFFDETEHIPGCPDPLITRESADYELADARFYLNPDKKDFQKKNQAP